MLGHGAERLLPVPEADPVERQPRFCAGKLMKRLIMQGSLLPSATRTLQEEESHAAFQGINNSAKGWVSSGRLGWPAGMLDAFSGTKRTGRLTEQESNTRATGTDCKTHSCAGLQSGQLPAFTAWGKAALSPHELLKALLGSQEGESRAELDMSLCTTATVSDRLCLQPSNLRPPRLGFKISHTLFSLLKA